MSIDDSIQMFQALSDPTRLRIVRLMASFPDEQVCLCEFTSALRQSEANVSRHLKVLRHASLLEAEKSGRWVYHRIRKTKRAQRAYDFVKSLEDLTGLFNDDVRRMKLEMRMRKSSRCAKAEVEREPAV